MREVHLIPALGQPFFRPFVILLSALLSFNAVQAQADFRATGEMVKVKAEVIQVGENMFLVEHEGQRYVCRNLPDEFKHAGLLISLRGEVLDPPVHVRLAGTPVDLHKVKALKNYKEHGVLQRKYKFDRIELSETSKEAG